MKSRGRRGGAIRFRVGAIHGLPLRTILLLLLLCLLLVACGKKGPVRPLLRAEPAAPGRPEARQIGGEILLLVDLPERNQDGTPLLDLAELRIFRREAPADACPDCLDPEQLWRSVDLLAPRPAGNRLAIRDADVRPGFVYRYRLVPVTGRGLTGAPTQLGRQLHPAPAAPQELSAQGFDRLVRLAWTPSPAPAEGWTLLGCNVFRSEGEAPFGPSPLTRMLVTEGRFDDVGPQNGILYRYLVRCVAQQGETLVESPPSEVVDATPHPE